MAIAKFAYADNIAFIECVENVVLFITNCNCLSARVNSIHKSNILHGVTKISNIYSNICINIDYYYFVYKFSIK
jgi:hypothetical protein